MRTSFLNEAEYYFIAFVYSFTYWWTSQGWLFKFKIYFLFKHVYVLMVWAHALGVQKSLLDLLEWELPEVASQSIPLPGPELGSSGRSVCTLNH